jgi:hypothetical protein
MWQTYQDYSKQKQVNSVDISDVTHKFAEEEWNKLPVLCCDWIHVQHQKIHSSDGDDK